MPNDNNDDDLTKLSIEEINDLYSDIIEFPDDNRISVAVRANVCDQDVSCGRCSYGFK